MMATEPSHPAISKHLPGGVQLSAVTDNFSHVFNPSQGEIDDIIPHLVWPSRVLHVLGEEVTAKSAIYDLGDGRIVKTGRGVSADEAKAMIFVRTQTNIPVPEVHMVFEHNGETHIVMELVDGIALQETQSRGADGERSSDGNIVSPEGLRSIMRQLKQIIEELRELGRRFPPTGPRYGSWPEGPFRYCYFGDDPPDTPFSSDAEFHEYFLKRLAAAKAKDLSTYTDLERLFQECAGPAVPVLTHGDLAPRNIIVKDNRIAAVVDWESFGWYPDFWEGMGIRNAFLWRSLREAMTEVFGEPTFAGEVYFYVQSCLAFPF
ncbi:kinase-like domain-containing protein [Trametes elegans]|nr:kinase-like domain-containing protein [Trametes elegans]